MRFALTLAALLTIVAQANADDPVGAVKQPPTDDAIIGFCGVPLAKVFDRFGTPEDLRVNADNDGGVDLEYGAFSFKIKNKTATACFFESSWKGPVKGVTIGDSKEQAVKTLGVNDSVFKRTDGLEDYGWKLKTVNATFWVYFDKDGKAKRIDAEVN